MASAIHPEVAGLLAHARSGWARTRATPTTRAATPSAKGHRHRPVTGGELELLWVKGSGGRPGPR